MATTQTVALDFLTKLEADLNAHKNGGAASVYKFAGYVNGQPVGITRTALLGLNRGGQILQFLAGYYTSTTDANIKARIATAAGKVYQVFAGRAVFNSYSTPNPVGDVATTGVYPNDPSGPLMAIGLMMIDKQGVIDHANFATNAGSSASYVRTTQIPRQAMKLNHALNVYKTINVDSLVKGENYTWATQKMGKEGLNGTLMTYAALSVYTKLYGVSTYSARFTEAQTVFRHVSTKFGNTYSSGSSEVAVTTTAAGQYPNYLLCLPVGARNQSRGPFPSIGYNSLVTFAMTLQAFAEKATTTSKFNQIQSLVSGHVLQIDAVKILNYYNARVIADGELYELGSHRNYAGDAKRHESAWRAQLQADGVGNLDTLFSATNSGQFNFLLTESNNPGQTGYAYSFMWTNPTHAVFSGIASKFGPNSGKSTLKINYGPVGTSAAVIQAFAATGEAAGVRAASGLGALLMFGTSTVN